MAKPRFDHLEKTEKQRLKAVAANPVVVIQQQQITLYSPTFQFSTEGTVGVPKSSRTKASSVFQKKFKRI